MPQDLGTCVLTMGKDFLEYHSDDPVVAEANWNHIHYMSHLNVELFGRNVETVGMFTVMPNTLGSVITEVLRNVGPAGKFALSDGDAAQVYQCIEDGTLLGLWHTHPHGHRLPSAEDWAGHPHGVPMYIVSMEMDGELMVLRYDSSDRPGAQADPEQQGE